MTFIANSELCELRVFAGHIPKFGCGASRARTFVVNYFSFAALGGVRTRRYFFQEFP
jgi:hypothetical protein